MSRSLYSDWHGDKQGHRVFSSVQLLPKPVPKQWEGLQQREAHLDPSVELLRLWEGAENSADRAKLEVRFYFSASTHYSARL